MKRLSLTLCMVLGIMTAVAIGQSSLVFDGGKLAEVRSVRRQYDALLAAGLPQPEVADSLLGWVSRFGYLDAEISRVDGAIRLSVGQQSVLRQVVVRDSAETTVAIDEVFTPANLDETVETILGRYYADGYHFARAEIADIRREGYDIHLTLDINAGPQVILAENRLTGLVHTRPEIVEKYLTVGTGDTLTADRIRAAERAASEIAFLTLEPPVTVRPLPGYTEADLEYRFVEKRRFGFFGGAGYVPDDNTGLLWNVNLEFRNLFGGGRQAQITTERRDKGRQVFRIGYRQPVFLFGVGEVRFDIGTRDYRDEFYEFAVSAGYEARLTPGTTTGVNLGWKRVEPTGTLAGYSRLLIGLTLGRTTVDYHPNPSSGYELDWSIAYSHRRYSPDTLAVIPERQVYNETRTDASFSVYQCLIGSLVGHIRIAYSGLETSESLPPLSELTLVGGPGTLRGYRNEQFVARRTAFGTVEPRFRFEQGYLFAFYDAAYINRPLQSGDQIVADEFYRGGYGFGLSLSNAYRAVTLSLGWGRDVAIDEARLSVELTSEI